MHKVIYQLTVKDVQNVAEQELGRKLSIQEIAMLQDRIANKISWYEVIADSIDEMITEIKD
jgi:hypothetical protein